MSVMLQSILWVVGLFLLCSIILGTIYALFCLGVRIIRGILGI